MLLNRPGSIAPLKTYETGYFHVTGASLAAKMLLNMILVLAKACNLLLLVHLVGSIFFDSSKVEISLSIAP